MTGVTRPRDIHRRVQHYQADQAIRANLGPSSHQAEKALGQPGAEQRQEDDEQESSKEPFFAWWHEDEVAEGECVRRSRADQKYGIPVAATRSWPASERGDEHSESADAGMLKLS